MLGNVIFDWVMFVILAFLTVWFLTGHGEKILQIFDGNSSTVRRKLKPEEKQKFLRACGVFCAVLCLSSLMLALFHAVNPIPLISIIIAVADIIGFAVYTNRNFPNDPRF